MTPDLIQKLKKIDHECLWHPFTQMKEYESEQPLIIDRGEGNWLIDIEGKKYLDAVSSLWVTVHGHRKKELDEALKNQIDKIAHSTLLGLSNTPALLLAEALLNRAPQNLKKVFYSDSGSTALEIALKMAYQYFQNKGETQKNQFVTLENAYHGDTIGSVSIGGIDLFHSVYKQLLFHTHKIKNFDLDWTENLFKDKAHQIAALFVEPLIQGAAGMLLQPPGFLSQLRKLTQKYGILMIADEVATGFGRTGKMFACEHEAIEPDLMCVAKGITGGYLPLAATLTTQEIFEGFYSDYSKLQTFFHGHTYTGNPLACAVALENLNIFEREKTIENIQSKIELFQTLLAELPAHPHVKEIRQLGLMMGIQLIKDKKNNLEYELAERIGNRVILCARKKGVVIRPLGSVIVLMPPLSITHEEIFLLVKVLKESIEEVCV